MMEFVSISCFCVFLFVIGLVLASLNWRRMRRQRDALIQEKDVIFRFIHDISEAFAGSVEPQVDFLLQRVLLYAQQTAKARGGAIYFCEPDGETLRARAVSGLFPPLGETAVSAVPPEGDGFMQRIETLVRNQTIVIGAGLVGQVAKDGYALLIEDAERDQRVPRFASGFLQIQSILLAPMRFQSGVLGVLALVNRIDGAFFNQADLNLLQALADHASITIYYAKFHEELEKKRVLDSDLRVARRIQKAMLPTRIPLVPGLDMAAFSEPAREIGGDYYDFVRIDQDHIGLAIADVSGKGVSGAILMSVCRSVFRAHAEDCLSPARILKRINEIVSGDIHEDMFISMLYAILDTRSFEMTLARAGHPRPLLVSGGGSVTTIDSDGLAIGLVESDLFDLQIRETTVILKPDDFFIMFTDGVFEAMNAGRQEWGLSRLQDSLAHGAVNAEEMLKQVRCAVLDFSGDAAQYDDMTFVVVHRLNTIKGVE